jgi:hypothetical protein
MNEQTNGAHDIPGLIGLARIIENVVIVARSNTRELGISRKQNVPMLFHLCSIRMRILSV